MRASCMHGAPRPQRPRKALRGGISKSISQRPCQALAMNTKWLQERTWNAPTKGLAWGNAQGREGRHARCTLQGHLAHNTPLVFTKVERLHRVTALPRRGNAEERAVTRCLSPAYQNARLAKKARTGRTMPQVCIRYGDTVTGKTRWLGEPFGFAGWRCTPTNTGQWFDGRQLDSMCIIESEMCAPG